MYEYHNQDDGVVNAGLTHQRKSVEISLQVFSCLLSSLFTHFHNVGVIVFKVPLALLNNY